MAVLNKIRQRSLFLIIVIALALFSFVLADLFKSGSSFSSSTQNIVATVNGKDITREYFMQKVEAAQRQAGSNATSSQVINQVYEQEVRIALMENQYEKLGLTIEKDQMRDLLKSALATSPEFLNEAGLFDENKLNEYIANLKETSPQGYEGWINYENSIAANALQQNYFNLVRAGLTATLKEGEMEHMLEANKVDIQFVQIPYTAIADDKVEVSNSDISDYIKKHKKQFEVDASRDIRFVQFNEVASAEDEDAIKASLTELLSDKIEYNEVSKAEETIIGFSNSTNNESFVNNNSDIKFDQRFMFKSDLPVSISDSISNLSIGQIYGPYSDNGYYKMSKLVAVKQIPDSAKVRHILIPFLGSNSAGPEVTRTEAQAKTLSDSLLSIIRGDKSKFSEFVTTYSSDQGSVTNEGRYDWHPYNSMVPEFNEFEFEGKVGDLGVVKTAFGYHIIEIEGQKNVKPAYQLATIARQIEPTEATVDKIFRDASNFELAAEDKDFEAAAKEQNLTVLPVNSLKILDESIPGIGSQRPIVRWAFEDGTDVGDVKRFNITNGYVIAQIVAKHKEGLMTVEKAKATVMPIVRNKKKAALIKSRVKATNLEALAKAENTTIKTSTGVVMKNPMILEAGREPLVVGAAFGLKEGATSKLLEGDNGVYMLKVTKVTPAPKLDSYQAIANRVEQQKLNVVSSQLYNALKEASDIEDNRAKNQIQ